MFHCGWFGEFGAKGSLSLKSFLATQDLQRVQLTLWLEQHTSYSGYENNIYLKPLLPKIVVRSFDAHREARDTPLAGSPLLDETKTIAWADVFRILVLYKHGGCYFDLDMLFLRDFLELAAVLPQPEFCYQWSAQRHGNSAILKLERGSEAVLRTVETAAKRKSCHPRTLFQMDDTELNLLMLPGPFFDPVWLLRDGKDQSRPSPFSTFSDFFMPLGPEALRKKFTAMADFWESCFCYHWHNQWGAPETGDSLAGYWNRLVDRALRDRHGIHAAPCF
jgi:hypothetical protein